MEQLPHNTKFPFREIGFRGLPPYDVKFYCGGFMGQLPNEAKFTGLCRN